jgi:hypothetical protein
MPRTPLLSIALLSFVLAALGAARPCAAQPYLSGGKHTLAVWNDVDITPGFGNLEISLPFKGKRKSFVLVQSAAVANPACPLQINVLLNGAGASGVTSAQSGDCAGQPCSVSASSYYDLDALETANPGDFIGKQLTVRLQIARFSGSCTSSTAQFIAQLVKK